MAKPTLPKRKRTESASGWRTSPSLKLTTRDSKLGLKVTILKWTHSLTWTLKNLEPSIWLRSHQDPPLNALDNKLPLLTFPQKLTGPPRVELPQLKIKVNVDHVGLSHQLEHWKVQDLLHLASFSLSQNNNLLTAPKIMETKPAMEVWWTNHSGMLEITESPLRTNILIVESSELADTMQKLTKSGLLVTALMLPSIAKQPLLPLLLKIPFQLPFKLTTFPSNFTRVESTQETAEPTLTTEFWLSDTDKLVERNTTKSRTHGEVDGEIKATSTLLEKRRKEKENAESKWLPHTPLPDSSKIINQDKKH